METVLDAIARFRADGYELEMSATPDGSLRCGVCGVVEPPSDVTVDEVVRYEGESDPGDEAIVLAITTAHGDRGYLVAAYGPDMPAGVVSLLQHLPGA